MEMFWWLVFAVFLYVLCAILIVLEILIPSFGLLTICSIACLVGGVWTFFSYGTGVGWAGIATAVVIVPVALVIAYKYLPKTRFGKSVILEPNKRDLGDAIPDSENLSGLIGKRGVVLSSLRPVGRCEFDGNKIECVAESGFVEIDSPVEVVKVESSQVTVREIKE